ncbi:MAG: DUF3592 domain-containing protein [Sedimentisphaerales bacterium]|nr:DUF3592 domain-containing protein [Sedimentisphaerales bacterium]
MKTEYKRQLWIGGALTGLFCLGGAVLIALGVWFYDQSRAFKEAAETAPGKVVGYERWDAPGQDLEDDITYAIIEYTLPNGKVIHFQGPSKDGPVTLHRGDPVTVLYNPADPTDARVDSFMGLWFACTMLLVLGSAAIVLPLLTFWQGCKWVQRQEAGSSDTMF